MSKEMNSDELIIDAVGGALFESEYEDLKNRFKDNPTAFELMDNMKPVFKAFFRAGFLSGAEFNANGGE